MDELFETGCDCSISQMIPNLQDLTPLDAVNGERFLHLTFDLQASQILSIKHPEEPSPKVPRPPVTTPPLPSIPKIAPPPPSPKVPKPPVPSPHRPPVKKGFME